ncbi:MAG: DUF3783 domain-containing protein [Candidatus Limivivens sp.]|nr:DUF3783 domain-containing protein [Candidatus Limivivens sp.]
MANSKMILTYELSRQERRQLEALAREFSILLKPVAPSQYRQSLGFLCKITGMKPTPSSPAAIQAFPEPVLVFSGLDDALLDAFLGRCREESCLASCLKAVLTPVNIFWNSIQLYEELTRERNAIKKLPT